MFLSKSERNFLLQREDTDKNQQRYIRYKLRRKIKHFYYNELPLLVEQGYISAASDVAANSWSEAACSHTPEKKTSKNGINHAQHSDSGSATRHFNAKVARADRASGGDGYYLGSTVRSSIGPIELRLMR